MEPKIQNSETGSVGLNKGKKRKRAQPAKGGWSVKKGTGQLTKFDDSEDDTPNPVKKEETKAGVVKKPEPVIESPAVQPAKSSEPNKSEALTQPSEPISKREQHSKARNKQPQRLRNSQKTQDIPAHLLQKRDELRAIRKSLPIWHQADSIRAALQRNNVLVLTGETGSGKSTQLPQFLTNESWCTGCIAITQPRRVAAISLARRSTLR